MNAAGRLAEWEESVQRRQGARDSLRLQRDNATTAEASAKRARRISDKGVQALREIEEGWHKEFEQDLAGIVSQGMTLVFQRELEFIVLSKFARGQSAVDFELAEDDHHLPILGFKGGGYVNVASFLLRMRALLSAQPPLARVAVLDEPFAEVSDEFLPNVAMLLRQVVDEAGIQLIVASHEPAIGEVADVVHEISLDRRGRSVSRVLGSGENVSHLYER
jgi:hypothetical protein